MSLAYNNSILNNHKTFLFCGLFVLFILFTIFPILAVKSLEENKNELNIEENNERIKQIKDEMEKVQIEVNKYEIEVKKQQKKARTLQREIAIYQNKMNKNKLEIKETKLLIEKNELEMEDIKKEIKKSEIKIEKNKDILKNLLKILYTYEQDSMLEILITQDSISDFFNEVNAVNSVKEKMFKSIMELKEEKENLNLRSEELEEQQDEKAKLIQIKAYQNESLSEFKIQKNELLDITKGEEKHFQQLLEKNKNILPSLRAQLYDLQSLGNKLKFDDAFSAAKFIGSKIGIRPAYLLGILKVESNLGKNTGSGNWENDMYDCYMRLSKYYPSRKTYYIKRANTEKKAFFSIVKRLNLDPDSVKVSREPTYGCGGAMGPAQFIPSTWLAYEQRISNVTGHYPPNPWDLADAMGAMAVKVSDIPGVIGGDYDAEYEAAGRYLGGINWRSKGLSFYPNQVMLYASLYEEELN